MNAHPIKLAISTALAAMLALAALPAPAHAQFGGGLLKAAKRKAAEKITEKAVDKAAEKAGVGDSSNAANAANAGNANGAGGNAAGARRRGNGVMRGNSDASYAAGPAPTYSANLLEITNARIDQLMKGLDGERAYMAQLAKGADAESKKFDAETRAYEAKHAAYEKKVAAINARMTAFQNCMMSNAGASGGAMPPGAAKMQQKLAGMSEAEQQVFMNRLQELGKRGEAADKRGDRKAAMAIMDTVYTLMGMTEADRQAAAAAGAKALKNHKDCGEAPKEMTDPSLMPVEPQPPTRGDADDARKAASDQAGAKAAGLTVAQYGLLRERVAALVVYNGRPGTAWGFSESERQAVSSRRNEFNKYEAMLGGTAISWRFSDGAKD